MTEETRDYQKELKTFEAKVDNLLKENGIKQKELEEVKTKKNDLRILKERAEKECEMLRKKLSAYEKIKVKNTYTVYDQDMQKCTTIKAECSGIHQGNICFFDMYGEKQIFKAVFPLSKYSFQMLEEDYSKHES